MSYFVVWLFCGFVVWLFCGFVVWWFCGLVVLWFGGFVVWLSVKHKEEQESATASARFFTFHFSLKKR